MGGGGGGELAETGCSLLLTINDNNLHVRQRPALAGRRGNRRATKLRTSVPRRRVPVRVALSLPVLLPLPLSLRVGLAITRSREVSVVRREVVARRGVVARWEALAGWRRPVVGVVTGTGVEVPLPRGRGHPGTRECENKFPC